jgi:hypothetical protein
VAHGLQERALKRAARITGGPERLRDLLGAPPGAFCRWLAGDERMPASYFALLLAYLAEIEARAAARESAKSPAAAP